MIVRMELYRSRDLECISALIGSHDRPASEEDGEDVSLRLAEWVEDNDYSEIWVIPVRSNTIHLRHMGEVTPLVRAVFDDREVSIDGIVQFVASCLRVFGEDSDSGRLFIRLGDETNLCSQGDIQRYVDAINGFAGTTSDAEVTVRPARVMISHHCLSLCVERLPSE